MNETKIRRLARLQAIIFWLIVAIGLIMIWLYATTNARNLRAQIFLGLVNFELLLGLTFSFASGFLANAVKKSPLIWFAITLLLGPIGYILAYAILSTTAKKLLTIATQTISSSQQEIQDALAKID